MTETIGIPVAFILLTILNLLCFYLLLDMGSCVVFGYTDNFLLYMLRSQPRC